MEALIGPAIVAAFIAALVSAAGWFVTTRQTLALERRWRQEKTWDFQIALRAEIQSELADLDTYDVENGFERIKLRYDADPNYSVFVPKPARHLIFEAIFAELYILPENVIDPVVLYMRQRQVVVGLCEDIRSSEYRLLSKERQLEIYRDYLNLRLHLLALARQAIAALSRSPS